MIACFNVTPPVGLEDKKGMSSILNGNFEHAAVIAGYYYVDSKLHLIAAQMDNFYEYRLMKCSTQRPN